MNKELARDYLEKSEFSHMQADAFSKLLAEMATKEDLLRLESRMDSRFQGLEGGIRAEIVRATSASQTQMMRWGVAMIIAMSSIFTLLDVFID